MPGAMLDVIPLSGADLRSDPTWLPRFEPRPVAARINLTFRHILNRRPD